jgi:UDP-2-acetamido-2,6-beta-L-arabino-hexul-4-ose reductase
MLRIGITGQSGFIGTHLFNTLKLYPDKYTLIPFEDSYFQSENTLNGFVAACDVIVHLAALNRHNDPKTIYQTNLHLVGQIIKAAEFTHSKPHLIFSSSTQEERDNPYGNSKREGRELFASWASRNEAKFTGMVIPNVFGPFGNPYYNSVIATFCHQLTHGETPRIEIDGEIKLIYVGELVRVIMETIDKGKSNNMVFIPHTKAIRVSDLLHLLEGYWKNYSTSGIIPDVADPFEKNLFNTLICFIDHKTFFPFKLRKNTDTRGSYVETVKASTGGQVAFSTTVPGITRGNHFHTRKAERFAVIKGKALIQLRRTGTDEVMNFELSGEEPAFVDMPVWFTHNITNIGNEDLYTIFWINEFYDPNDPDTFFEPVMHE